VQDGSSEGVEVQSAVVEVATAAAAACAASSSFLASCGVDAGQRLSFGCNGQSEGYVDSARGADVPCLRLGPSLRPVGENRVQRPDDWPVGGESGYVGESGGTCDSWRLTSPRPAVDEDEGFDESDVGDSVAGTPAVRRLCLERLIAPTLSFRDIVGIRGVIVAPPTDISRSFRRLIEATCTCVLVLHCSSFRVIASDEATRKRVRNQPK